MDTWALDEMSRAKVADARRRKSMATILTNLAQKPGSSFSAAAGHAKRQAFHRLAEDKKVKVGHLISGHIKQTLDRIQENCGTGLVLIAQDTCAFDLTGRNATTGLGYVNGTKARGIFGHSALALTPNALPLGVLHLEQFVRNDEDHGKGKVRRKRTVSEKESQRWVTTVETVEAQLAPGQIALFVQDREGDIFALLEAPKRKTTYLLIRANQPRKVEVLDDISERPKGEKPRIVSLFEAASSGQVVGTMDVTVPRSGSRPERRASLLVQTASVHIRAPKYRPGVGTKPVRAWIVRATEIEPPAGDGIEWVLISTMPVADGAAAFKMVEYYSRRWAIERLHFTLKSGGCNAERLQMDDVDSMKLALELYYITAWRLMYLTYYARQHPDSPAELVLSELEIAVLEQIEKAPVKTIAAAFRAIGKLGGHEPYKNGPPAGVKVLWIGLRRLEDMATGWLLAVHSQTAIRGAPEL